MNRSTVTRLTRLEDRRVVQLVEKWAAEAEYDREVVEETLRSAKVETLRRRAGLRPRTLDDMIDELVDEHGLSEDEAAALKAEVLQEDAAHFARRRQRGTRTPSERGVAHDS